MFAPEWYLGWGLYENWDKFYEYMNERSSEGTLHVSVEWAKGFLFTPYWIERKYLEKVTDIFRRMDFNGYNVNTNYTPVSTSMHYYDYARRLFEIDRWQMFLYISEGIVLPDGHFPTVKNWGISFCKGEDEIITLDRLTFEDLIERIINIGRNCLDLE